jgi:hypothetical protein
MRDRSQLTPRSQTSVSADCILFPLFPLFPPPPHRGGGLGRGPTRSSLGTPFGLTSPPPAPPPSGRPRASGQPGRVPIILARSHLEAPSWDCSMAAARSGEWLSERASTLAHCIACSALAVPRRLAVNFGLPVRFVVELRQRTRQERLRMLDPPPVYPPARRGARRDGVGVGVRPPLPSRERAGVRGNAT